MERLKPQRKKRNQIGILGQKIKIDPILILNIKITKNLLY